MPVEYTESVKLVKYRGCILSCLARNQFLLEKAFIDAFSTEQFKYACVVASCHSIQPISHMKDNAGLILCDFNILRYGILPVQGRHRHAAASESGA